MADNNTTELTLNRLQLKQLFGNNQIAISAFENLFKKLAGTTTIITDNNAQVSADAAYAGAIAALAAVNEAFQYIPLYSASPQPAKPDELFIPSYQYTQSDYYLPPDEPTQLASQTNNGLLSTSLFTKLSNSRETLKANRIYFVSPTGNNSNSGLTVGAPFLTLQKAWDTITGLDLNGFTATVTVAAGTTTGGLNIKNAQVGGPVTFDGAGATTIISTTSAHAIQANNVAFPAPVTFQNMKLQTTTAGDCIYTNGQGTVITLGAGIEFGTCADNHIECAGGSVICTASYTVSGGAKVHWLVFNAAQFKASNITITLTGVPAFSVGFSYNTALGNTQCDLLTFVGTATGKRYNVNLNSAVNTGSGANLTYLPGNVAGTTATGGQYV